MLAVHRLARLVASDLITVDARDAFIRGEYARRGDLDAIEQRRAGVRPADYDWTARALEDGPDAPKLAQLVVCRWCTSMWLSAGVLVARRLVPSVWGPVSRLLAFSSVAGLLGVWEHFTEPQKVELEEEAPERTIRLG